ncbi:hypothetical protein HMPREF9476_03102 [Clostridium perfringens WAL-14572]|jgi:hypothetical protein|nr:hypothetical protein HMPREF9476_03102 [Clostridium perfringens WAL-14572]DAW04362.1 MAG TPA: hypothetical protein [Caudoviricetes sp.]
MKEEIIKLIKKIEDERILMILYGVLQNIKKQD